MTDSPATAELPKSLQALIVEARNAVDHWEDDGDDVDESGIVDASKDWCVRLSRGEYKEDLYWECAAQDCEAAGDWDGAKAAYRKVLQTIERDDAIGWMNAHNGFGGIQRLLGEPRKAFAHFHAVTQRLRGMDCSIFYRVCLDHEALQCLCMGRVRAARKLVKRGLASFEKESTDGLGYARLMITQAACEMAEGNAAAAVVALEAARPYLDELYAHIGRGSGLDSVDAAWWRVEADRRRQLGEGDSEIEARQKSLAKARRAAEGWNRVGWDASVMRALQLLADACQRHGRPDDAAGACAEAEEIRRKWHLPELTPSQCGDRGG